eukprot:4344765-Karenia_brevis.AAC.2
MIHISFPPGLGWFGWLAPCPCHASLPAFAFAWACSLALGPLCWARAAFAAAAALAAVVCVPGCGWWPLGPGPFFFGGSRCLSLALWASVAPRVSCAFPAPVCQSVCGPPCLSPSAPWLGFWLLGTWGWAGLIY